MKKSLKSLYSAIASTFVAGTLLVGIAAPVSAYPAFQTFSIYYSNTPFFRGTANNWDHIPLVAFNAYKYSGISYSGYVNVPAGPQQFKYDVSAKADWSQNYGSNNPASGCLDSNGSNISLQQGAGTYEVQYNTGVPGYGCGRPFFSVWKRDNFTAQQRSMYLRTSFNNWGLLPMLLVRDNVWEAEVLAGSNTMGAMKFDVQGDWSKSFGRPFGSDPRSYTNTGYATVAQGENLALYVEDYSGTPNVTARIRFNDATSEFALCPNVSKAICQ